MVTRRRQSAVSAVSSEMLLLSLLRLLRNDNEDREIETEVGRDHRESLSRRRTSLPGRWEAHKKIARQAANSVIFSFPERTVRCGTADKDTQTNHLLDPLKELNNFIKKIMTHSIIV